GELVLQILKLPSFYPYVCYELYSFHLMTVIGQSWYMPEHFMLVRITHDHEARHTTGAPPVLEFKWRLLDPRYVDAKFKAYKACRAPVWFSPHAERNHMGNDGTNYELAFGEFFLAARYRWWSYYPDEWRELAELTESTIQEFESVLV
ncbi:MAG: hypothetical protein AAF787_15550, partial [Chloroflexota bacterium]